LTGPLDLDGDRLYAFGMNTPNTVYDGPFLAHDWRGFGYFAHEQAMRDLQAAPTRW
jgi:hypothetical protein